MIDVNILNKYSNKKIPNLIKILTTHFNKFIRYRDRIDENHFRCISCNLIKHNSKLEAGHFYSAGSHSAVRFDEDNVHGQCHRCNFHLSANLINYRINLINKIGIVRFNNLEQKMFQGKRYFKWDRIDLILKIEKYKLENKKVK